MEYHFDTFVYEVVTNLNSNLYQVLEMGSGTVSAVDVEVTNLYNLHHIAKNSLHAQVKACRSELSF
jgi:hypothetical protein